MWAVSWDSCFEVFVGRVVRSMLDELTSEKQADRRLSTLNSEDLLLFDFPLCLLLDEWPLCSDRSLCSLATETDIMSDMLVT